MCTIVQSCAKFCKICKMCTIVQNMENVQNCAKCAKLCKMCKMFKILQNMQNCVKYAKYVKCAKLCKMCKMCKMSNITPTGLTGILLTRVWNYTDRLTDWWPPRGKHPEDCKVIKTNLFETIKILFGFQASCWGSKDLHPPQCWQSRCGRLWYCSSSGGIANKQINK